MTDLTNLDTKVRFMRTALKDLRLSKFNSINTTDLISFYV